MAKHQIIALDVMGGDFGPQVVVPAAARALKSLKNTKFLLFGDETRIQPCLELEPALRAVSQVIHTDKIVSSEAKPSVALRGGRDSSMWMAIEAVKKGDADSVVSAGNTGALMAMSKMLLKCLPGIHRPAIAGVMPTVGEDIVMLDLGANVSCDEEILVQFAILGAVFSRIIKGHENPSVGLLNVGVEEMKGNEQLRAAAGILANVNFPGKFHGFIEGDDIALASVDVVVTDGFTGNVALKVTEGVAKVTNMYLKNAFKSSPLAMLGGFLAYGALKRMKKRFDPRFYNGGMFLGLNGICVKSHGGMDEYGFSQAIMVAANLVEQGYNDRVAAEIERLMEQESFISLATPMTGEDS